MRQCLTVLSRIQPTTYKNWEQACWDDLSRHSLVCLTIDMDMALRRCIDWGYVSQIKGIVKLTDLLQIILIKLDKRIQMDHDKFEQQDKKRKDEFIDWIKIQNEQSLKNKLLKIIDSDEYDSEGNHLWENLEWLLLNDW